MRLHYSNHDGLLSPLRWAARGWRARDKMSPVRYARAGQAVRRVEPYSPLSDPPAAPVAVMAHSPVARIEEVLKEVMGALPAGAASLSPPLCLPLYPPLVAAGVR
eukprot:gene34923-42292_t